MSLHQSAKWSSQVDQLVTRAADFGSILNAQIRMGLRANVPLSVRLRGRVHISGRGGLVLGDGVSIIGTVVPVELVTYASGRVEIGNNTFINYGSSIAAREFVKIGAHCHLGHYTFVMDNDQHHVVRHMELPQSAAVIIEDHVWIGAKAVILPGVRIGSRAVIGAGSVVTKDVPPQCVAAGNPARVLRYLTGFDELLDSAKSLPLPERHSGIDTSSRA
ncbi:MAG: acyltransferase [Hyphomicrobiaceae bacterium]